ncbi:SoxR reducing system RseC family protein [Parahaliea sp. F7430]|uniref:SoxR reducing system RseC family protein n=1 Tax=Sediminihaliea albiluteola TaxID=2758564 RepID=A0A7W2TVA0_9GAMM|nr:SoxR reducing system RseC family protein [Sediminihaliea albiluteola]MBA6412541.1 SoxR reducing system RseC family protein [Sediminihaliea albiluteola]
MLIESGEVVAVDADALWVETLRQSTCGTCSAQKGCGHGLLNRVGSGRRHYIRVLPGDIALQDCRIGDQVSFAIPESVILRGSLVVYVLPLLSMLGAAVLGAWLFSAQQDLAALLGAVMGFVLGAVVVRWHAARHQDDVSFQPTLVKRQPSILSAVELA